MVKDAAKAKEPNEWMDLVRDTREKNPGMCLKDVLRLASKKRGDKKKRGGVILPLFGGDEPVTAAPAAPAPRVAAPAPAPRVAALETIPEEDDNALNNDHYGGKKRSNKSHRKSRRSKKSSRKSKSKSKKSSKRRH